MDTKPQYTLGKNERLKSRKAIDALFSHGKSFSLFPFKVIWKKTTDTHGSAPPGPVQAAFSVSKRNFKKATDRNRIKRLMREAWRLQKNDLTGKVQQSSQQVVVFLLYVGNEMPVYKTLFEKTGMALKKLERIINEDLSSNM